MGNGKCHLSEAAHGSNRGVSREPHVSLAADGHVEDDSGPHATWCCHLRGAWVLLTLCPIPLQAGANAVTCLADTWLL